MDNRKTTVEKLQLLREEMKKHHIDIYLVSTMDYHLSEDLQPYYKTLAWLTGLDAAKAILAVTESNAILWVSALSMKEGWKEEAAKNGVSIRVVHREGNPLDAALNYFRETRAAILTEESFRGRNLSLPRAKATYCIGFDGRAFPASFMDELQHELSEVLALHIASIEMSHDLVGEIWTDRPPVENSIVTVKKGDYEEEGIAIRLTVLRRMVDSFGEGALAVLSDPYQVCSLIGIQGSDLPHAPVCYAYLCISADRGVELFCKDLDVTAERRMRQYHIKVHPYETFYQHLTERGATSLIADPDHQNCALFWTLQNNPRFYGFVDQPGFLSEKMQEKSLYDIMQEEKLSYNEGAAFVAFYTDLLKRAKEGPVSEAEVADLLDTWMRKTGSCGKSRDTLVAFGPNTGEAFHVPSEDAVYQGGLIRIGFGYHYQDPWVTTSSDRMILLPGHQADLRRSTAVTAAFLRALSLVFPVHTGDSQLDIAIRSEIWSRGFKSEGPCGWSLRIGGPDGPGEGHTISWSKWGPDSFYEFCTLETLCPSSFEVGKEGAAAGGLAAALRIDDERMRYAPISVLPFDPGTIDFSLLPNDLIKVYDAYQAHVREVLESMLLLNAEELEVLRGLTAPVGDKIISNPEANIFETDYEELNARFDRAMELTRDQKEF